MTYKISLVHRYTGNCDGIFFEGCCFANTTENANTIVNKFLKTGKIELFEAVCRYTNTNIACRPTIMQFASINQIDNYGNIWYERKKHAFGDGFVHKEVLKQENGKTKYCSYFFWLIVEKFSLPSNPEYEECYGRCESCKQIATIYSRKRNGSECDVWRCEDCCIKNDSMMIPSNESSR